MNLNEFVAKYEGRTVGYPTNNDFYGECLSLAKWYCKEVFGFNPPPSGVNAAYGYWTNFPEPLGQYFNKINNTREAEILPGDMPVWTSAVGNGAGHIAVCTRGGVDDFVSLDQNWGGRQAHKVTHNFSNIFGWLRPKESMADTIVVNTADWEKVRANSETLDQVTDRLGVPRNSKYDVISNAMNNLERKKYNEGFEAGKAEAPPTTSPLGWVENGLTIEITEGNVKRITNYKKE